MKMYTVAEVAELLDVNEETVRRWRLRGRNGVRLECIVGIGKQGHRITAPALRRFLEQNPGLATPALEASLAAAGGEEPARRDSAGVQVGEAQATFAGNAATTSAAPQPGTVAAPGGADDDPKDRVRSVFQALLDEKLAQRAQLQAQLARIDEEIEVLRGQVEKG